MTFVQRKTPRLCSNPVVTEHIFMTLEADGSIIYWTELRLRAYSITIHYKQSLHTKFRRGTFIFCPHRPRVSMSSPTEKSLRRPITKETSQVHRDALAFEIPFEIGHELELFGG